MSKPCPFCRYTRKEAKAAFKRDAEEFERRLQERIRITQERNESYQ